MDDAGHSPIMAFAGQEWVRTAILVRHALWRRMSRMTFGPDQQDPTTPGSDTTQCRLLQGVAAGDVTAFGQLYDEFSGLMFSMALRILRDRSQAEDVLQDVFLQIWNRAEAYDSKLGKPLTWMITLTRNRAIDRLRANSRGKRLIEVALENGVGDPHESDSSFEATLRNETASNVRAAITWLPAEQRQAIELAFFGGLTQTEITSALGLPLGTVKARIRRGLIRLRKLMGDKEFPKPETTFKRVGEGPSGYPRSQDPTRMRTYEP